MVVRLASLEKAKVTLQKEFIGIDEVIEQMVQSTRTWFTLPGLQTRPVIINLWGLTGTGKTSLTQKFTELIGMDGAFYNINMGDSNDGGMSFYNTLDEVFEHNSGKPFVLLLDEFQHARTKVQGQDRIAGRMANIWKMLDSGRLEMHDFSRSIGILNQRIKQLRLCLKHGVEVENGYVSKNLQTYCDITNERIENADTILRRDRRTGIPRRHKNKTNKLKKSLPFYPSYEWDELVEISKGRFTSEFEVEKLLAQMDGEQVISFLEELLDEAKKPKILDCSKALIIVAGNLDEAYQMSHNQNPDIPADVWKKLTKDISLNHIKAALSLRFREEHIARLGNNHIIYPAMGEKDFKDYIQLRVNGISKSFLNQHGLKLMVARSVLNIIYQEGVYPTQGFRPVNTTIDRFVQNNLSEILGHKLIDFPESDQVRLSFSSGRLIFEFYHSGGIIGSKKKKVHLTLQDKRLPKRNNDQALTSVHEAGHVVCCAMLLGEIPEIAVSATSDTSSGGFVIRTGRNKVLQRSQLIRTLSFKLGGYAAEKLIFGKDNLTTGSSSDITGATLFVRNVLADSGFEDMPAAIVTKNERLDLGVLDHDGQLDKLVVQYLKEAEALASKTLESERILLMEVARALFDKGLLKQPQMKDLISKHAVYGSVPVKFEFPFKDRFLKQLEQVDSLQKVA